MNGVEIVTIAKLLGHVLVETTERYIHLSDQSVAGAADRARNARVPVCKRNQLSEVFVETAMDGATTGFVLAQLGPGGKPMLWVQDQMSRREAGRPCLEGIRPAVDLPRSMCQTPGRRFGRSNRAGLPVGPTQKSNISFRCSRRRFPKNLRYSRKLSPNDSRWVSPCSIFPLSRS